MALTPYRSTSRLDVTRKIKERETRSAAGSPVGSSPYVAPSRGPAAVQGIGSSRLGSFTPQGGTARSPLRPPPGGRPSTLFPPNVGSNTGFSPAAGGLERVNPPPASFLTPAVTPGYSGAGAAGRGAETTTGRYNEPADRWGAARSAGAWETTGGEPIGRINTNELRGIGREVSRDYGERGGFRDLDKPWWDRDVPDSANIRDPGAGARGAGWGLETDGYGQTGAPIEVERRAPETTSGSPPTNLGGGYGPAGSAPPPIAAAEGEVDEQQDPTGSGIGVEQGGLSAGAPAGPGADGAEPNNHTTNQDPTAEQLAYHQRVYEATGLEPGFLEDQRKRGWFYSQDPETGRWGRGATPTKLRELFYEKHGEDFLEWENYFRSTYQPGIGFLGEDTEKRWDYASASEYLEKISLRSNPPPALAAAVMMLGTQEGVVGFHRDDMARAGLPQTEYFGWVEEPETTAARDAWAATEEARAAREGSGGLAPVDSRWQEGLDEWFGRFADEYEGGKVNFDSRALEERGARSTGAATRAAMQMAGSQGLGAGAAQGMVSDISQTGQTQVRAEVADREFQSKMAESDRKMRLIDSALSVAQQQISLAATREEAAAARALAEKLQRMHALESRALARISQKAAENAAAAAAAGNAIGAGANVATFGLFKLLGGD